MKNLIEEIADKYVDKNVQGEKAREMAAWGMLNSCPWFDETEEDYC